MKKIDAPLAANAAAPLTVTYHDGSTEAIRLRKLSLGDFMDLLAREAPPDELAGLYAQSAEGPRYGRSVDWVESLTPESQLELLEQGGELNRPLEQRFLATRESLAILQELRGVHAQALSIALLTAQDEQAQAEMRKLSKNLSPGPASSTSSPPPDTPPTTS